MAIFFWKNFAIPQKIPTFAPANEREAPKRLQNNDGAIAQLVEHRTENPCVPGSNPGGTTTQNASV